MKHRSKGYRGTTRGKEKILMTSVGIEPTTSGLDLPLLCRLSYVVGQRKSGTIDSIRFGLSPFIRINLPTVAFIRIHLSTFAFIRIYSHSCLHLPSSTFIPHG